MLLQFLPGVQEAFGELARLCWIRAQTQWASASRVAGRRDHMHALQGPVRGRSLPRDAARQGAVLSQSPCQQWPRGFDSHGSLERLGEPSPRADFPDPIAPAQLNALEDVWPTPRGTATALASLARH